MMKRRLSYLTCFLGLVFGIILMVHLKLELCRLELAPSSNCYLFEGDIDGEAYYSLMTHRSSEPPLLPDYFECISIRSICLAGTQLYFLHNGTCYHINLETDEMSKIPSLPSELSWEDPASFFKQHKRQQR